MNWKIILDLSINKEIGCTDKESDKCQTEKFNSYISSTHSPRKFRDNLPVLRACSFSTLVFMFLIRGVGRELKSFEEEAIFLSYHLDVGKKNEGSITSPEAGESDDKKSFKKYLIFCHLEGSII